MDMAKHRTSIVKTSLLNITIERVYTTPVTTPHTAQNSSFKTLHMRQQEQLAYTLAHHHCERSACDVSDRSWRLRCHGQAKFREINEQCTLQFKYFHTRISALHAAHPTQATTAKGGKRLAAQ
jgi:hypothetical protein